MTLTEFEARAAAVPDLQLGWQYWNWLLPTTTGEAILRLFVMPALYQASLQREAEGKDRP